MSQKLQQFSVQGYAVGAFRKDRGSARLYFQVDSEPLTCIQRTGPIMIDYSFDTRSKQDPSFIMGEIKDMFYQNTGLPLSKSVPSYKALLASIDGITKNFYNGKK